MNSPLSKVLSVIIGATLFTALLYKQHIGLNLFLFEVLVIGWLAISKRITTNKEVLLTVGGTLITGLMVVVHNSLLAIAVNFLSLFLMTGVLLSPRVRSLIHSALLAVIHMAVSQFEFFKQFGGLGSASGKFGVLIRWVKIVAFPLLVLLVFVAIYSAANPVFDGMLAHITDRIDAVLLKLSEWVNFGVFWFFIFGMFVCDFLLLRTVENNLERTALTASDNLLRKREKVYNKKLSLGLKLELKSGVLLLFTLNLLLLLINAIDVYWVWFNFEWDGDYLKQFVHEGTYLLIVSIMISIAISMYLFRGNQNFYSKNGLLRKLTIVWLIQNAILALSVAVRNLHYIEYYALAYKRVGVFFFLVATIVGLTLVILKIQKKKTFHFVLRTNAISLYTVLVIMTFVNWDVVIAKYNFKHYEKTFTHFDFLWNLSFTALPYQSHSLEFLKHVEESNTKFPSDVKYLSAEQYHERVNKRTFVFKEDWEERDWRSWNLAYQTAYTKITE